jgi:hypothetical protein
MATLQPSNTHPKKTHWLACALVGFLAFGALAPLASADDEDDEEGLTPASDVEKDKSLKCKWLRLCKSPKHFPAGEFNETSGFVSGRYVEFTYNNTTGILEDVSVKFHKKNQTAAVKIFDSVALAPFNETNATLVAQGSKVTVKSDGAMYVAHDVRRSLIGAAARNGDHNLTYDLADGCVSKLTRRGAAINCENITGLIVPHGENSTLTLGNGTVTIEIDDKGAGAFTLVPPKSRRVSAWMHEHSDELRDRAKDEAREHRDEMRDRAKDRVRDEVRDRREGRDRGHGDDDGSSNNTTASP